MTTPESRFISVGGLRLHYLDWGNENAPALLFLHDLGASAESWNDLAPEFIGRFHVLAIDLRGHGDSDWIDTYSPQEQGDDIGELTTLLGLGPAAVIGMGMGGRAGALLAARQDHLVSRLVMIDSGVDMYLPAARQAAELLFDIPRVYDSQQEFAREWWQRRYSAGLTRLAAPLGDASSWEPLLRPLSAGGLAPSWDVDGYQRYRAWSPGERSVDYHDEFDQITCPVLLVRGAGSPVLTAEAASETVAAIPNCSLVVIPDARHDLLVDNPAGLLEVVLPFLAEA